MSKKTVKLEDLGVELKSLLNKTAEHNAQVVADEMRTLSFKFQRKAIEYYPSVLNRRSGNLIRSIARFTKRLANVISVGLRDKMTYARYLEEGTKHITARKFLETPILEAAQGLLGRLKQIIGFNK